jgi:Tfp pilus assembly PilM family ATPase
MSLNQTALGIDIGTSRVVLAQQLDQDYEFKSQLNAFVTIPYNKITQGVLRREGVPHQV